MLSKKTLEEMGSRPRGAGAATSLAAGAFLTAFTTLPFSPKAAQRRAR